MNCPICGLFNPDTAVRCDCGYDFPSKEVKESYLTKTERESRLDSDPKGRRKRFWQKAATLFAVVLGRNIFRTFGWRIGNDGLDAFAWIVLFLGILFAFNIRHKRQKLMKTGSA